MTPSPAQRSEHLREQHKLRLCYMPWLYWTLKPKHQQWARPWQLQWQQHLTAMETIDIRGDCFIAPSARLFAEPGRAIVIEQGVAIAADTVIHGPVHLGPHVAINHHGNLDGGRRGIHIGEGARIAAYCQIFAFNHGMDPQRPIRAQPVTSKGIHIGADVWLGARVGITDGVTIGNGAVVGMNSTVTDDLAPGGVYAGSPARRLGPRD